MDYKALQNKYQQLLLENNRLKEEIKRLKAQPGLTIGWEESQDSGNTVSGYLPAPELELFDQQVKINSSTSAEAINKGSGSSEKIQLFMSLFRGRDDVYARRWENKAKGIAGYSPACGNEWKPGICQKPKIKCSACKHKDFLPLSEMAVDAHLRGRNNLVAGIYPLLSNETCWFLAIDFDDEGWQKDVTTLSEVCSLFEIPVGIERSRSGNGAHAWFFFEYPVPASLARKFGSALLTHAMSQRHEITFKSYDRFFPNQDNMPKGGFGNLIALPLQKEARKDNNSVFIDEHFHPIEDQWAFLASLSRLSEKNLEELISKLCPGNELGTLKTDDEEASKPWETIKTTEISKNDFPGKTEVVKANMLFIPKADFSQKALNHLKRLAAFKNPEFYKAQAMRLPTFDKPRIISCSDETAEYLCLPRGCETDIKMLFEEMKTKVLWTDKTNHGRKIDVAFNGSLRDEQPLAVEKLLEYDDGILCGTTAFGKTVAAIKLIAERKVNTLIFVDKVNLVSQWREKLSAFLIINEPIPINHGTGKKGRNKSIIGQMGAGKQALNGIIDIAVMQSLNRLGEVKDCVKDYGMVIVDECHHVSAFSFEMILKNVGAKYVYGLTATPVRKDGHHPIIFMQCGPIRYRDDAKKQAEKRPFDHFIIPRFTSFNTPLDKQEKDILIHELYAGIIEDEMRNQLIVDDVIQCHQNGRNCLVLTERTTHVESIANELSQRIPDVISLMGGMGTKETRETMARISETPEDKPLTLVATGRYIGEGFDEPRLDTLFLAMPISWKGTLQQYAGRLHRLFETKKEVLIYDYVDVRVRMLERMYNKRLAGYASIGYKAKGENLAAESTDIIFDKSNFLPVYSNDIVNASKEILIVSPFVTIRRTLQMMQNLKIALAKGVKVVVLTRPAEDFKDKDLIAWKTALNFLKSSGIVVVFKSNIHQKFAVMDEKIVWYGSINLLSFGSAEESIMRLESSNIANELIRSITKEAGT
ncbi:TOTE conflict system archaeo-eukaryotic primase domain-containing protein [Gaoshiqia sediminis]|uniref:DEAD/DEAH box helicase family protein n=1 Tax=Gaoshiqia sediminis TaxID=2986998 RepID=A0AA41YCC4_9BACT|nr:DEAD/DEAH box helicase family protein [Gaoshiqia sediminis]MCW0483833.1 DEAD/DEAH box helicase family protein [Gaoshiqia sediminis]